MAFFHIYGRNTERLYFVTSGDDTISVTADGEVALCHDADLLTMRCAPLSHLEDNPVALAACRAAVAYAKAQGLEIDAADAFYE
ncbi:MULTISPECIES: hypothetical protein [Pseudoxanthomonas]|jgi:hypothetical protein|uniref:Uncharacterized protein n=1 Tax=Pseudoxanthomonas winnipegensis TaxID=2480810 RepID=A0A4Q8LE25_9GAMM|nr:MULTISPECIES: hypothetical protein [Pseudoxanthomonas]PZP60441.1 MAG: hypothetical protein DI597_13120 [Pseudoxanthomonas spadix]TAA26840.1 hypothetical protein EA660_06405 [Pseudoxanthomonas winnipegensis]TMN19495.1 hypothetical protein FF950_11425 [Pseudoxanthomonas sp. X-1]UAY75488.1 hypothetical protein LAJ50_04305 [Pseudoxanthomonas sp. X-1]